MFLKSFYLLKQDLCTSAFWEHSLLGWRMLSVHCRRFSSISGPYLLDADRAPVPVMTTKQVSRHRQTSPGLGWRGGQLHPPVEKHCFRNIYWNVFGCSDVTSGGGGVMEDVGVERWAKGWWLLGLVMGPGTLLRHSDCFCLCSNSLK